MNSDLVTLSEKIAADPDSADVLLSNAGLTQQQYQKLSFYQLQKFNGTLTANAG